MNILNSVPASSVLVYSMLFPPTEMVAKRMQQLDAAARYRIASERAIVSLANEGVIPTRKDLMDITDVIDSWPDKIVEPVLFEKLEDGLYTRELHMPKGVIVAGKIHKYPYFVSILKGKCRLLSEHYNKIVEAPMSFTLPAGIKHIVYNIEDTVWSDVHNVKATTTEEAAEEIFANSYEELDEFLGVVNYKDEVPKCLVG